MANREVAIEASVYRSENKYVQQVDSLDDLLPTTGAIEVYRRVMDVRNAVDIVNRMQEVDLLRSYIGNRMTGKTVGGKSYGSFVELSSLVDDVENGRYVVKKGEQAAYDELWNLRADIIDGFSLGAIFQPGKKDDLRLAVETKRFDEVERFFGIKSGDLLSGLGEVVVNTVITDEKLIRRLGTLQSNVNSGDVEEAYARAVAAIEGFVDDDSVDYEEAQMVLAYLSFVTAGIRAEKQAMQESRLPKDRGEQLSLIRGHLDYIESTRKTSRDYALSQRVAMLEEMALSSEIHPDVAREIRSRLSLHDCAVLMKKANGYVETPRSGGDPECPTVGLAATLAEGMGHALNQEAVNFFLKQGANGIPVDVAWDLYQDVNIGYPAILTRIQRKGEDLTKGLDVSVDGDPDLGRIDASYYTDSNPDRKRRVDQYVIGEIVKRKKVDRVVAEKAWRMAKDLALATGENSVFNAAMTGNDEMAEDMYLKLYRKGRYKKGRPSGPQINIERIVGVGNSWLRRVSDYQIGDGRGLVPLYAKDVSSRIEEGSYVYHYGVWWSAKIHPLRGLLLDRQPDPTKIVSRDFLQTAVDYFVKGDTDGSKKLRYFWVAGVLDMACSNGMLGWTQDDISRFRQFLTREKLTSGSDVFLSQNEWDRLMTNGKFVQKMLKLDLRRVGRAAFDGAFGGSGGGKRSK